MEQKRKDTNPLTLEALIRWSKGKASDEESAAVAADLHSPKSRILTVLGDPHAIIKQIRTTDPQIIGTWKRAHRDHFEEYMSPGQADATQVLDKLVEESLKEAPSSRKPPRRNRGNDSGSPAR